MILYVQLFGQKNELKHLVKYTQANGLSSYNVRNLMQDSKGFIWVATQEGIDRFDGNNFVGYKKNASLKKRVCGTDIRQMVEDSVRNCLWVLPGEFGLNSISMETGDVIETIPIPQNNTSTWNLTMLLNENRLWIGTSTGLIIYNIKKKQFESKIPIPKVLTIRPSDYEVKSVSKDSFGNIWVCYRGIGIVIYTEEKKIIKLIPITQLAADATNREMIFNSITFINLTQALVATDQGVRKINFDNYYNYLIDNTPFNGLATLNKEEISCILKLNTGEMLIASPKGLMRFDKSLKFYDFFSEGMTIDHENWLATVQSLCIDSDGNIWAGCQNGLGFISKKQLPFKTYYQDDFTKQRLEHVRAICKLNNGNFLVGLSNGLVNIDSKTGIFTYKDKEHLFHHIFEDKKGSVLVFRHDRTFAFVNETLIPIEKIYPEFKDFSKYPINSHLFIGDSLIVLGTEADKGILVWNYISHMITKYDEQSKSIHLVSNIVNNIYRDSKENLWILSDNILTVISKNFKTFKTIRLFDKSTQQPLGLFFDMCEVNNNYWIASYGSGIIELDSTFTIKNIYSTKNGLSNDGVYQVYDYKNNLIITTNYGISVLDINTGNFKKYFESDGLHSNGFEEVAGIMKDGLIYAGGVKGFTVINPELFSGNKQSPQLYINKIVLETTTGEIDTSNLYFQSFTIPNNTLQSSVYFSGLNYNNPTRTSYSYRIIEKSKEWINLSTLGFITLISQPPGIYHLQVKAANEDGVWSEPKELVLEFLPKWHQTWWFKLLVFLTTAGIIYAFYRYRIRQIEKQHEIRKNIATDLHDDLGSTLNSVKVFTNLAISGVKQEESLQQVKDNLTEATMSLRDMIWVLDDSLDTVDELVTRLKQFALPITAASNMEFVVMADSGVNSLTLTKEEKRNLFLICKEAINNSIKYSGATQIIVDIKPAGKKIQIAVADNGKGFDEATVKKGYGLKNMQYRAGQIKYKATLTSEPGNGTQVIITTA